MVQTRWGSLSITGNYRENNEDCCLVHPEGRYFLVADGMGGQLAGEKASEMATELISRKLNQSLDFEHDPPTKVLNVIDEAVSNANSEIMALGEIDPQFQGMGTTIAFLVSVAGTFYVGGVGDSRVYLLRGDDFQQFTTDHSIPQALVDAGTITPDEAKTHRFRNTLYRYLGTKEGSAGTEAQQIQPQAGDRLLLCSDGVTDGLEHEPLKALLEERNDPQSAAEAIVAAAQTGGSRDNITCVVVHVEESAA